MHMYVTVCAYMHYSVYVSVLAFVRTLTLCVLLCMHVYICPCVHAHVSAIQVCMHKYVDVCVTMYAYTLLCVQVLCVSLREDCKL